MFETEIKAALKKAGLAESLYNQITVKTLEEIDGAVATLKADSEKVADLTEEEFIAAIKKAGMEDLLKKYTSRESDKRVTEAIKTHEKKLAEKKPNEKKVTDDMTEEQKKIAELENTLKLITEKLEGVTTKITTSDMESRIKAEIKKAGLSEDFADLIHVDDTEKITDAVTSLKSRIDQAKQADINKMLESGELASVKKGDSGITLDDSKVAEYAKSLTGSGAVKTPEFQGKISAETTNK